MRILLWDKSYVKWQNALGCLDQYIAQRRIIYDFVIADEDWTCVQCNVGDIPAAREDAILQYSRAVMWEGLRDMVARDAIRENDGLSMISLWVTENMSFQDRGHNKYLIKGRRL